MPHAPFVHLRVHSSYSMLEGAMSPEAVVTACRIDGMPAVAITDRSNMYGALEFADAAKNGGVQPIMGALLAVERPGGRGAFGKPLLDWLALLAQDKQGYDNLVALVSAAHLDGDSVDEPCVALADLEGRTDGLIALTAGREGALARLCADGQDAAATAYLNSLQSLFPERLYIELSRCDDEIEIAAEPHLIRMAHACDIPLVATNPVLYPDATFHPAHEVMLCIADGVYLESKDRRRSSRQAWLKSSADMLALFADLPEAVANTLVVARRCAVMSPSRPPILPSLAGDIDGEAAMLAEQGRAGLDARLLKLGVSGDATRPYRERLDFELGVITRMGFAGYFLIVADFIGWAKAQGIPVGPGRGSGAGSVVAWSLLITDLDPLRLGLLFERFLNPERVSMPDFDIDFCETRRSEVIDYVQKKYGREQVAQIITFGRLKSRAVLKDVGRVLQMPYGQIERLAKMIPNHPTDPWTLERAINGVSELAAERKGDLGVRRLLDLAMKLEGLPRHSSTHAAGVVIGDRPLRQLVPMTRDPKSGMGVTQFDMKMVEKAGLVKFDFLGLKTLSVLRRATELLAAHGVIIDLDAMTEWDDPEVYALMSRADTVGVFQLESEGMRRTLGLVRPTVFEDIIALVSLYRPGPMDNIPSFGARKNGRERVTFPHPALEPTLAETYGIFVYQEQVMEAAKVLAGYSLGQADLLRRAMGKKIQAEMDAQREDFVAGCFLTHRIDKDKANELFDLIDKFAGYGFNKSHAAAYALIAYQTAWLKAHHKPEFYAASMAYDIALTDKLSIFVDDMRRSGVACLPPCVNASQADFSVEATASGFAVRYALGALKGVGEKAMTAMVAERDAGGPFIKLDEFAARVDPRHLNKRQLECLASAGAFECFKDWTRASAHAVAEAILATAGSRQEERETGQGGLFGGGGSAEAATSNLMLHRPRTAGWTLAQTMQQEQDAFGFFFSGHPVDQFRQVAEAAGARTYAAICESGGPIGGGKPSGVMAALVEEAKWRTPQAGGSGRSSNRYLLVTLSDSSGGYVASCFDEEVQPAIEAAARSGDPVLMQVELQWRPGEDTPRITIRGLTTLAEKAKSQRSRLLLELSSASGVESLAKLLGPRRGGRSEIHAEIPLGAGRFARLVLGREFAVDAELQDLLAAAPGVASVTSTVLDSARLVG